MVNTKKLLNPTFILIIFSGFYVTKLLPISPFYLGFVLSVGLLILSLCIFPMKPFISLSKDDILISFIILFYVFHIIFNSLVNGVSIKYPLFMALSPLFFFAGYAVKYVSKNTLKVSFSVLKYLSLVLFLFDCIYRLKHPMIREHGWGAGPIAFIYAFKLNGIIFNDTNSTSFLLTSLLCFFLYLRDNKLIKLSFLEIIFFFVLLVFTFSRAAIIGFLFFVFVVYFFNRLKIALKFFTIFIFIYFAIYIFMILVADESFRSKLMIFEETLRYIKESGIRDFLFGVGYENSKKVLDIYAHNYISVHLIEFGFIGLCIFVIMFLFLFIKCSNAMFLLLPYCVIGLSFTPTYLPYFYLYLGIIYNLEKKNSDLRIIKMKEE